MSGILGFGEFLGYSGIPYVRSNDKFDVSTRARATRRLVKIQSLVEE